MRSDSVQFVTSLEIRSAFGTTTSAPCGVWTALNARQNAGSRPQLAHLRDVADADRALNQQIRPDTKLLTMPAGQGRYHTE